MFGCCHIFLWMILLSYRTCEGDSLHSKKGLCGSSAVCCYCKARRECATIRRAIQRWLFVFMLSVTAGQIRCRCFINGITFTFSSGLSSNDNTPPLNTRDIHYCGLLFFVMEWWDMQLHAFKLLSPVSLNCVAFQESVCGLKCTFWFWVTTFYGCSDNQVIYYE